MALISHQSCIIMASIYTSTRVMCTWYHKYVLHWCLILNVHYVEVLKMFDTSMKIFFLPRVECELLSTISYQLQSDWTIEDKKRWLYNMAEVITIYKPF